jgi:hypothetical protein
VALITSGLTRASVFASKAVVILVLIKAVPPSAPTTVITNVTHQKRAFAQLIRLDFPPIAQKAQSRQFFHSAVT